MAVDLTSRECPTGFLCSGIRAGLKEESKKDLGMIFTNQGAIAGGVFTQNRFPAAPVQHCKSLVPANNFRALIVNSGNANAATGQNGFDANLKMAALLAKEINVDSSQVLTSSTGIIGRLFPIQKIEDSIPALVEGLSPDITSFSEAILTTDLKAKTAVVKLKLGDNTYTVTGTTKGSGMIHPNMATMLAYILTDAPIPFSAIQGITAEIAASSFNAVSIDGDTSTNDSFFLICSNPAENIDLNSLAKVKDAIEEVAVSLAKQIAADGEGAEHLIEVNISEAPSDDIAKAVLQSVLTSNLVKTAIHGKDPNWGRLLMAVGNGLSSYQVPNNLPISIDIQSIPVFVKGEPVTVDEKELTGLLGKFEVFIEINLHQGQSTAVGWGCDLSHGYVSINADYST